MSSSKSKSFLSNRILQLLILTIFLTITTARPSVRTIKSESQFDALLKKHATTTGLPVILDFYSDSCGPCRQIAPVYQKLAKQYKDKAVFAKIDVNGLQAISQRYNVRSMPTFLFIYNGEKVFEFSGAGEGQLRDYTKKIIEKSEKENVIL